MCCVNQERKRLLQGRILSTPRTSTALKLKVDALGDYLNAYDARSAPEGQERIREELLDCIEAGERFGTYAAGRGASRASRLLDALEKPAAAEDDEPTWAAADDRDRAVRLLEALLPWQLASARGWHVKRDEWRRGSARVRQVLRETEAVLRADDPLEAADEALESARRTG